jgi:hypothetical protein
VTLLVSVVAWRFMPDMDVDVDGMRLGRFCGVDENAFRRAADAVVL